MPDPVTDNKAKLYLSQNSEVKQLYIQYFTVQDTYPLYSNFKCFMKVNFMERKVANSNS